MANPQLEWTHDAGDALQFNGTSDYVEFSESESEFDFSGGLTVMAWVHWDIDPENGNDWANTVSINSTDEKDNGQFHLQHNSENTKFEFALYTTEGRRYIFSTTSPEQGKWYHIAGVFDGDSMYYYINGIEENSLAHGGDIVDFDSDFRLTIGRWAYSDHPRIFEGIVDEVSIWGRPLSASEIKTFMNTHINPNTANGLQGYWRFDENDGTNVLDYTGNGRDGTMHSTSQKIVSGAPIGDVSSYFSSIQNSYELVHPDGDKITVDSIMGTFKGLVLYYVDSLPNTDSASPGVEQLSEEKYYGVFPVGQSNDIDYRITYNYTGHSGIQNENTLSFASRPEGDTLFWNDEGVSPNNNSNTLTVNTFTNSGQFILASTSSLNTLPVELFSFEAFAVNSNVRLLWITASETNNEFFTIERSVDGKNFDEIGNVAAAGNSLTLKEYKFTDDQPLPGTSYYRLRQNDFDGQSEYSVIKAVNRNENDTEEFALLGIYPNPFLRNFSIQYLSGSKGSVKISIMNLSEKVLLCQNRKTKPGINEYKIDALTLRPGTYILMISQYGKNVIRRLVKN